MGMYPSRMQASLLNKKPKTMVSILINELLRKSVHLLGMIIPGLYYFIDRTTALFWLGIIVAIFILEEWLRLRGIMKLPKIMLRTHEEQKVAGHLFLALGVFIVIALFSKTIAIIAITMAVIGDTSSGIVGALWGRKAYIRHTRLPVKPAPILLVMFLASFISGYLVSLAPGMDDLPLISIVLGAQAAMLADGIPWRIKDQVLDDNLTIPIVSAFVIFLTAGV
jgi:phytol kinase